MGDEVKLDRKLLISILKEQRAIQTDESIKHFTRIIIPKEYKTSSLFSSVKKNVTEISDSLFEDFDKLEQLTLPDSIERIGHNVFKGCKNLLSINMPQSLREIGNNAFEGCISLTSEDNPLEIPSTVRFIGTDAFKGLKYISYRGEAVGANWGAEFNLAIDDEEAQRRAEEDKQRIAEEEKQRRAEEDKNNIIDKLKVQCIRQEKLIKKYTEEITKQDNKIAEKDIEIENLTKERDDFKKKAEDFEKEVISKKSLDSELQAEKAKGTEYLKTIASLKAEIAEECKKFEEEKQQLKENAVKEAIAKEKEIAELKDENLKLYSDNKILYSTNTNLEEDLKANLEENDKFASCVSMLIGAIDKVSESKIAVFSKEKELEKAQEEVKSLKEAEEKIKKELKEAKNKAEEANADLKAVKKEVEAKEKEIAELKDENLKLYSDNKILYSTKTNLERDLYDKNAVINRIEKDNDNLRDKLTDYKIRIHDLESKVRDL